MVALFMFMPITSALEVTKTGDYPVCQAIFKSLETAHYKLDSTLSNEIEKLSRPKWKEAHDLLGAKLLIQSSSFTSGKDLNWWEREIKWLKKQLNSNLQVMRADIDINNNGSLEKIVRISFYDDDLNRDVVINFIVDKYHNLDPAFYNYGDFSSVQGEIFLFGGRVFSLSLTGVEKVEYSIDEHFDDPMKNIGGLYIKYGVCKLES